MPTVKMSPRQAANYLRSIPARIKASVIKAESQTLEAAKREAIRSSSGQHTQAQLTAAGHPYARRRPNRSYNPGIINKQSGVFVSSWQINSPVQRGKQIVSAVVNTDPKKEYLFGTTKMVPRPLSDRVRKKITKRRRQRLSDALDRALTPR